MQIFARTFARLGRSFVMAGVVLLIFAPWAEAKKKAAVDYDLSGSVLFYDHDGQVYKFATDRLVYTLTWDKVKKLQFRDPQCQVNGRPIVVGDSVRFRIDGDQAYLPPASGSSEQELQVLFTELKTRRRYLGPLQTEWFAASSLVRARPSGLGLSIRLVMHCCRAKLCGPAKSKSSRAERFIG
jgi:hypothetical protein